jgi:hypothetical protein
MIQINDFNLGIYHFIFLTQIISDVRIYKNKDVELL